MIKELLQHIKEENQIEKCMFSVDFDSDLSIREIWVYGIDENGDLFSGITAEKTLLGDYYYLKTIKTQSYKISFLSKTFHQEGNNE